MGPPLSNRYDQKKKCDIERDIGNKICLRAHKRLLHKYINQDINLDRYDCSPKWKWMAPSLE